MGVAAWAPRSAGVPLAHSEPGWRRYDPCLQVFGEMPYFKRRGKQVPDGRLVGQHLALMKLHFISVVWQFIVRMLGDPVTPQGGYNGEDGYCVCQPFPMP